MTHIEYHPQNNPKNTATIDTEHLFIGTDGNVFVRDSAHGRLAELSDEQVGELGKHFGRHLNSARSAVKALA